MTIVIVLEVYHIKIFHQKEGGKQNEKHFEVFEQAKRIGYRFSYSNGICGCARSY